MSTRKRSSRASASSPSVVATWVEPTRVAIAESVGRVGPAVQGMVSDGVTMLGNAGRAAVAYGRHVAAEVGLRNANDVKLAVIGSGRLAAQWVRRNPGKSAVLGLVAAWWLTRKKEI